MSDILYQIIKLEEELKYATENKDYQTIERLEKEIAILEKKS